MPVLSPDDSSPFISHDMDAFPGMNLHGMKLSAPTSPMMDTYVESYSTFPMPATIPIDVPTPMSINEHHTLYYFNHIRAMEFPFADNTPITINYAVSPISETSSRPKLIYNTADRE